MEVANKVLKTASKFYVSTSFSWHAVIKGRAAIASDSSHPSFLSLSLLCLSASMATQSNCPNVLANGTCEVHACPHIHTIFTCEPCGFVFQSSDLYDIHLKTNKHHSKISGRSVVSYCSICKANVTGGHTQFQQHTQGRKHQSKALSEGVSPDVTPQPATTTSSSTACDLCQIMVHTLFWNMHLSSRLHKSREEFTRYMTAVEQSETDKNGVVVEGTFDFGFIDPPVAQAGKTTIVNIKTSQPFSTSVLLGAKLASAQGNARSKGKSS